MYYQRNEENYELRYFLFKPERLNTVDECRSWGADAARAIEDAKEFIAAMQDYQKRIYERVQLLSSAPYHLEAVLRRERRYKGSVDYFVELLQVFDADGIDTIAKERTKYPGNERHKAFAAFEALKKSHPGIVARKDIEKRRRER